MLELTTAAEYLRASHIDRWGIVQVAHRQSIAEHMYRVWTLIHSWGSIAGFHSEHLRMAEAWALVHDLPEIRTGDAPTPHKTPEIKAWLSNVEHQICPEAADIEHAISGTAVWDFCKFCDTAESVLFLKVNGLGKHAAEVQDLLEQQMLARLASSSIEPARRQALIEAFITTKHDT